MDSAQGNDGVNVTDSETAMQFCGGPFYTDCISAPHQPSSASQAVTTPTPEVGRTSIDAPLMQLYPTLGLGSIDVSRVSDAEGRSVVRLEDPTTINRDDASPSDEIFVFTGDLMQSQEIPQPGDITIIEGFPDDGATWRGPHPFIVMAMSAILSQLYDKESKGVFHDEALSNLLPSGIVRAAVDCAASVVSLAKDFISPVIYAEQVCDNKALIHNVQFCRMVQDIVTSWIYTTRHTTEGFLDIEERVKREIVDSFEYAVANVRSASSLVHGTRLRSCSDKVARAVLSTCIPRHPCIIDGVGRTIIAGCSMTCSHEMTNTIPCDKNTDVFINPLGLHRVSFSENSGYVFATEEEYVRYPAELGGCMEHPLARAGEIVSGLSGDGYHQASATRSALAINTIISATNIAADRPPTRAITRADDFSFGDGIVTIDEIMACQRMYESLRQDHHKESLSRVYPWVSMGGTIPVYHQRVMKARDCSWSTGVFDFGIGGRSFSVTLPGDVRESIVINLSALQYSRFFTDTTGSYNVTCTPSSRTVHRNRSMFRVMATGDPVLSSGTWMGPGMNVGSVWYVAMSTLFSVSRSGAGSVNIAPRSCMGMPLTESMNEKRGPGRPSKANATRREQDEPSFNTVTRENVIETLKMSCNRSAYTKILEAVLRRRCDVRRVGTFATKDMSWVDWGSHEVIAVVEAVRRAILSQYALLPVNVSCTASLSCTRPLRSFDRSFGEEQMYNVAMRMCADVQGVFERMHTNDSAMMGAFMRQCVDAKSMFDECIQNYTRLSVENRDDAVTTAFCRASGMAASRFSKHRLPAEMFAIASSVYRHGRNEILLQAKSAGMKKGHKSIRKMPRGAMVSQRNVERAPPAANAPCTSPTYSAPTGVVSSFIVINIRTKRDLDGDCTLLSGAASVASRSVGEPSARKGGRRRNPGQKRPKRKPSDRRGDGNRRVKRRALVDTSSYACSSPCSTTVSVDMIHTPCTSVSSVEMPQFSEETSQESHASQEYQALGCDFNDLIGLSDFTHTNRNPPISMGRTAFDLHPYTPV